MYLGDKKGMMVGDQHVIAYVLRELDSDKLNHYYKFGLVGDIYLNAWELVVEIPRDENQVYLYSNGTDDWRRCGC